MRANASLSQKLIRIGVGLLVVALTSIGLTLWVTRQLEGGAAAVNEAGRMRMQTWRLSSAVQAEPQPAQLRALVAQFDQSLSLLRTGNPTRPLFVPRDAVVQEAFTAVTQLGQEQRSAWLGDTPTTPRDAVQAAGVLVDTIDHFVSAIEHQMARLTALLNLFQFVMMVLALGAAIVMLYTGYLFVLNPLAQLRRGLQQLESGDFATRIAVDTEDEFGQVAAGFNGMASRLQSLYEGLESQVQAKTRHIEAQRMRIETLYEVSAFLASANTMDELSQGFAQRVRRVMHADAVAVRWADEAQQRYLMLASDCFPKDMLECEHSLLAGACACGNVRPDAGIRVIPVLQHEEAPLRHCVRAGFDYLVSVPVRLQQRVIGEIDLFFRSSISLRREEEELLDALASHLASALEGLRAAALEREAAVGEERALLARELHDSIAQSLAFLKIQVQLLRNAIQSQQPEQVQQVLDELDVGVRESMNDVRELLVHFRTRTSGGDVATALQETLQKFRHQSGLLAHLQLHGEGLPLPPDVQVQVLHIVQEALSNVRKHAGASRVDLEVTRGPQWQIAVRDNGIGFDAVHEQDLVRVGLRIMRERAQRIGASVALESGAGRGTTVTLTLPAHPIIVGASQVTAP